MDRRLQYEDIKGSHVVIHSQYFNWISWWVTVVNQIHMESWLKAFFELLHHTSSKGRIITVWMQMIAFSLQSLRLLLSCSPSPPIPHYIFKHGPYSCAPCTCFMHTKKQALRGSFSLCHSVYLDESDIVFLCFLATISVVITLYMGRICLCKYAVLTERFPLYVTPHVPLHV